MDTEVKVKRLRLRWALFNALAIGIGLFPLLVFRTTTQDWLQLVLMMGPLICLIFLAFFDKAEGILVAVLVLSLPLGARLRLSPDYIHLGGAEAAIAPLDLALIALGAHWIRRFILGPERITWRIPIFDLRFWIFVGVSSFSLITSREISLSLLEIIRMLKMYILILLIRHYVKSKRELLNVLLLLLLGLGIQSSLAIAQDILKRTFSLGFLGERDRLWLVEVGGQTLSRAGGTLGHANVMASYLELLLPLTLALSLLQIRTRYRVALLTLFGLGTAAMILTLSRSGWGGLAFGSLLTLWLVARRKGFRLRRLLPALLPLGITVVLIAILFWHPIMARLFAPSPYSVSFRLKLARGALEMMKAQPLIGVGLNTFKEVMTDFPSQYLFTTRPATVHNIYLLVAAETGVLGLLFFLWLLIGIFGIGFHYSRSSQELYAATSAGICGGLAALLVHDMLSWLFRFDPVFVLFWFLVGLLTAVARLEIKAR